MLMLSGANLLSDGIFYLYIENMQKTYQTSIELKVRDYECDMQGIVNNAVYQNYLEHARHEYLIERGFNFADIIRDGIHLVVIRAEIDYKKSLKAGQRFKIVSALERISKLKFCFHQTISTQELSADIHCVQAKILCASLTDQGKPRYYPALETLF